MPGEKEKQKGFQFGDVNPFLPVQLQFSSWSLVWQFGTSIGVHRRLSLPPRRRWLSRLPDKPSIAVLPFVNMSDDQSRSSADGITENIITALSQVPNLFVIARNSTFTYKGKPVKVQQVAEELGVRYVLEGSVQRSGETCASQPS